MPILSSQYDPDWSLQPLPVMEGETSSPAPGWRARTFPSCANPHCASGWLRLWRNRRVPVVEGGWLCSPACTHARIEDLMLREQRGARPAPMHRHRVPIGLVLLTQGWVTHEQLKQALRAQRVGSKLRLGEWLMAHCGLSEQRLAQALGVQWSCPVFSLEEHDAALSVTVVPRLLLESFGLVPLRLTTTRRLYLAFEDRIDHSLVLAIERMTGLRVVAGLLSTGDFAEARRRVARARFARARLIEAANADLLVDAFACHLEERKPTESRLVRMRDLLWLRLWHDTGGHGPDPSTDAGIEDVIGAITDFRPDSEPDGRVRADGTFE